MNRQRVHRDSSTGEFVTAEYAGANPDTTQADWVEIGPVADRLTSALAGIVELSDSQVAWTAQGPAGIVETGVDPADVAERVLRRLEALVGEQAS